MFITVQMIQYKSYNIVLCLPKQDNMSGSRPRGLLGPCTHLPPLTLQPTHTLLTPLSPHSRANDKSINKTKRDIKKQSKYTNTCEGLHALSNNLHKNRLSRKIKLLKRNG